MSITVKDLIERYQAVTESQSTVIESETVIEEDESTSKTDSVKVSLLGKLAVLEQEEQKVFSALSTGVIVNKILDERIKARNNNTK